VRLGAQQRHQREDTAFAIIVDPHGDGDIFDRGDDHQGPEQQ
jgi:hypothetical protein